jgi:hypothetical protein
MLHCTASGSTCSEAAPSCFQGSIKCHSMTFTTQYAHTNSIDDQRTAALWRWTRALHLHCTHTRALHLAGVHAWATYVYRRVCCSLLATECPIITVAYSRIANTTAPSDMGSSACCEAALTFLKAHLTRSVSNAATHRHTQKASANSQFCRLFEAMHALCIVQLHWHGTAHSPAQPQQQIHTSLTKPLVTNR